MLSGSWWMSLDIQWIRVGSYCLDRGWWRDLIHPDPLALKLVTVECLGQHQSFALKIGSQELIPWTLDGQRAVCPGWAAPWIPLAIGFLGLWGRRPFVTSPSAPKSWVITRYGIAFGTGFRNHSYEMLWTQMNTTSCCGQTIGILVRGCHGSQMVTHRSIKIHPNFDSFPFISYFFDG